MEKISSARIALKWGLICGVISMLVNTVLYNTELWKNWISTAVFSLVLCFGILYLAMNEFKKLNDGFMSFSEGIGLGTLCLAMGSIIGFIYDFIYRIFIDSNIYKMQMEMAREQYESMGMAEESINAALKNSNSGLIFIIGIIALIFFGFIGSLIMSAIMQKSKPVF